MEELRIPKELMMGCTTAAVLSEGGNRNTDWYQWCETPGRIEDGTHVIRGNDHWNRYAEDIRLMKELNQETYCMSIEWSRIEPEPGQFDQAVLDRYRKEIALLVENGIKPLITLYQFSFPLWLAGRGGWENPQVVDWFMAYVRVVVNQLGDLVSDWMTMNDPNLSAGAGYLWGWWPPGKKDLNAMYRAMRHMILAHIKGYREIHQIRNEKWNESTTKVGVAFHTRIFDPVDARGINKRLARLSEYMFTDMLLEGMVTGKLGFPLGFGGYPLGKGRYSDFIGINYFTRNIIAYKADPKTMFCEVKVKEGAELNEGGWEIYPEGLYRCCKKYYDKYRTPIFITENGVRDSKDQKRPRFIYNHLYQVVQLRKAGIPVERYYHWTLIDLFEAHSGEGCRLGLVANDFETQERTIRASGRFYGEICQNKIINREMIEQYGLEEVVYNINK